MVSSEPTWHVSRVQKRVSKFVNFKVQKVQKPDLSGLTVNWVFLYTLSAFQKHMTPLWRNFLQWLRPWGMCDEILFLLFEIRYICNNSVHIPEFWPKPRVRALEVGVHLHVVLEVLKHLRLEPDVPVLDDDHPLNMNHSQYCVCKVWSLVKLHTQYFVT